MSKPVTAALVIIGDEILSGRTQDANLATLAAWLGARGVRLMEARVVPDIEGEIVDAVNALRHRHRYLFTTGGIGPTHDDITAAAVAKAVGRPFLRNAEAKRRLLAHYTADQINEARLSMADMPEGAELIDNPVSVAPGFRVENVFVLAGVPKIMAAMLDHIATMIEGGAKLLSRSLTTTLVEGDIADGLRALQDRHPDLSVGSYPFFRQGDIGVSVVMRHTEAAVLDAAEAELVALITARGGQLRPPPT